MGMADLGMVFHYASTISKNASPTDFMSVVTGLKEAPIQNVMANVSPAQMSRSRFDPPIFHPIDFRRDGRFGGTDMYLLRADCNDKRWETERQSVRNLGVSICSKALARSPGPLGGSLI